MSALASQSGVGRHKPFHVMTKPIGPLCNLDCSYCFYLEKEKLFPSGEKFRMSDEVLETYIRQYLDSQPGPEVSFAWQGGEPTLMGVDYFRKVVALQRRYAGGRIVRNALQTNGTLLDDEWGEFLKREDFLIGVSIDGPRALHDTYRVDKGGRPTFDKVIGGIEVLRRHGVEFNTLTVVNNVNVRHPLEVYRFLKEIGSGFIQFIPLVERSSPGEMLAEPESLSSQVTSWSVPSEAYGEFLVRIFEEWVRRDVGRVFVQTFDVALGNWSGMGGGLCVFSENCGRAVALEHNGDVYSCDHYVYPQYRLGNLLNQSLGEMLDSPEQEKFGRDKSATLPRYCRECEVRFACHGECPKHRFIRTPDGEAGLNYLCAGYKRFFTHVDPYMRVMTNLLRAERAPATIMQMLAREEVGVRSPGRNNPCPCGSGRKYKQCHGRAA